MNMINRGLATLWVDKPTILNNYSPKPLQISWKAVGDRSLNDAEKFANDILKLVEYGRIINDYSEYASLCTEYVEDKAVCDDEGEPKGQCTNCGAKWFEHSLNALPDVERDSAAAIQWRFIESSKMLSKIGTK